MRMDGKPDRALVQPGCVQRIASSRPHLHTYVCLTAAQPAAATAASQPQRQRRREETAGKQVAAYCRSVSIHMYNDTLFIGIASGYTCFGSSICQVASDGNAPTGKLSIAQIKITPAGHGCKRAWPSAPKTRQRMKRVLIVPCDRTKRGMYRAGPGPLPDTHSALPDTASAPQSGVQRGTPTGVMTEIGPVKHECKACSFATESVLAMLEHMEVHPPLALSH